MNQHMNDRNANQTAGAAPATGTGTAASSAPVAGVAAAPAPAMHPLFPGRTFISTVLDALDSKEEMTGTLRGKYMQRAVMAGFFVGIFFTTFFVISATFGALGPQMALAGKVLACLTFGWALVLIYYTNSELLTSNMMIVSIGAYHKRIGWLHSLRLLGLCLLGNLAGGLIVAILLRCSSITDGVTLTQMIAAATTKTAYVTQGVGGIADLFVRAIFCNFCINIGMLMVYNGKLVNDFTKCVIMVVVVFVFAYLGFEHSIADSVLFLIVGLHGAINPWLAIATIIVVLLGNFVGGGLLIGLNFAVMNDTPHNTRPQVSEFNESALVHLEAPRPAGL
ncbi:formate/nitrite transporter family protein [Bifidobacterium moraviense]|uniref:formate/nitrite transporter family protein n=1 Tax=Bifidobacterium moraviense TaxID=2675323 RepID=UPI002FFA123D